MIENNLTEKKVWYQIELEHVLNEFQFDLKQGLNDEQVTQRQEVYGRNDLGDRGGRSI